MSRSFGGGGRVGVGPRGPHARAGGEVADAGIDHMRIERIRSRPSMPRVGRLVELPGLEFDAGPDLQVCCAVEDDDDCRPR